MATIGMALTSPEYGWKRYDDSQPLITYSGSSWVNPRQSEAYNGSRHYNSNGSSKITFQFTGTKLRIIGFSSGGYSRQIAIKIDGVEDSFSQYSSNTVWQSLNYEKLDLSYELHTVEIYRIDSGWYCLDAIDIDETGYFPGETPPIVPKFLIQDGEEIKVYQQERNNTPMIPVMDSYEKDGITVSAQEYHYETSYPWKAFDGSRAQSWSFNYLNVPVWLRVDFGKEKTALRYSIERSNSVNDGPITWRIEGSNDEIDWVILDNQSEQPNWAEWVIRNYSLKQTGSYRYYQIVILKTGREITNPYDYQASSIGELQFYEDSSEGWKTVASIPVTEEMFINNGMNNVSDVSEEAWSQLSPNAKILAYTDGSNTFTADVTTASLYDDVEKLYRGTGVISTDMEEIPEGSKYLMVNADHTDAIFEYSLDNGVSWNPLTISEITDISKQTGTQLIIKVNLPTDTATLTAISYAWA
jgi:hypothetical protein